MTNHYQCKDCDREFPEGVYLTMLAHIQKKHPQTFVKMILSQLKKVSVEREPSKEAAK